LRTAQTHPEPVKEITKIRAYNAAMKKGRTSKPDKPEIQKAICNRIAASNKSVRSILRELSKSMNGVPDLSTFMEWLNDEEFAQQYARAKEEQYAFLAEEILEIADDESLDVAFDDKGKPFVDKEHITRSKLRVDARKLILSELKPKISPDKTGAGQGAEAGISATGWGAIAGLSDLADRTLVRPMVNGFKGMGDWGKVGEDILNPLGAVHDLVGTWICTATAKHSTMTRAEESVMSKLRTYAQKNHLGWWDSYFKNGTRLVKEIAGQENDLPKFYDNIRKVLVEPVIKTFDKDPEEAFQIYLFVTQTLFKAYMPEFVFKEIE